MEKEALEYLVNQGVQENPIVELKQGTYSKKQLERIELETAATLKVSTLTGLVDYIKANIDGLDRLLIQIKSNDEVLLFSPLNEDRNRELFIKAEAILPTNIRFEHFMDTERFNIMLQSSFVANDDKDLILKYTGLIQDDAVKTTGDDGVSQAVTIKTGIASVGQAVVPNPVVLAPYRTFPEVNQPKSKFIFRMKEGPSAAIIEADGGAWRNEAIQNIKKYLQEELKEIKNIEIIA